MNPHNSAPEKKKNQPEYSPTVKIILSEMEVSRLKQQRKWTIIKIVIACLLVASVAWELSHVPPPCSCTNNAYNCFPPGKDFTYQEEAQSCFEFCLKEKRFDIHYLDADANGIACENLPAAPQERECYDNDPYDSANC